MEMTGGGKRGKPKPGFPSFPPALGNRCGDSHIPTTPAPRGKVENQKQVSHFPTCCLVSQIQPRKEAWRRIASLPPSGSFFNEKMLADTLHDPIASGNAPGAIRKRWNRREEV